MSCIYFHSPSAEVTVAGTERAWMGCLTDDLGLATVDGPMLSRLDKWCEVWLYGRRVSDMLASASLDGMSFAKLQDTARLAFRYGPALGAERTGVFYQGRSVDPGTLTSNTAMNIGAPHVQLAVRLHNQCEIHAWVDGPNRAWLADLIDAGLHAGTFRDTPRRDGGWRAVAEMLRSRDDEPVVTSYSACDQFPNAEASTWMPAWPEGVPERWDALTEADQQARSDRSDAWYDLPSDEQWRMGMDYLRSAPGHLELVPEGFGAAYHFGASPLSWLDLEHHDAEARVRAALGMGAEAAAAAP